MKTKTSFLAILVLSMPATSVEHSDMKMGDMGLSASSQAYISGTSEMHEEMTVTVKEPDPDKTFIKGVTAHHEGTITMAETELKHGKDSEMRKLAEDIIKAQKGEIDQVSKWLDSQK